MIAHTPDVQPMIAAGHRDSVTTLPTSAPTAPLLIGIAGSVRAGADTVAGLLVDAHEFRRFAFCDPLREALLRLDPMLDRSTSLRMLVADLGWDGARAHRTYGPEVRRVHDVYAQVSRDMFGEDAWVRLLEARVAADANLHGPCPVVVCDVQSPIEAQWVAEHGGVVWRVERPRLSAAPEHETQPALDPSLVTETLLTDASPQALSRRLDRALHDLINARCATPLISTAVTA